MQKEKIRSVRNIEESNWYTLFSSDKVLNYLDEIFGIYDNIEDFELNKAETKIESLTKEKDYCLFVKKNDTPIYIVISKNSINLIIRKTGNYEDLVNRFNNYFEFIKSSE